MASYLNGETATRRVVITGMGVIAANGQSLQTFWDSILKGQSAGTRITRFKVDHLPHQVGAQIESFDCSAYMARKKAHRFELSIQYGIAAAVSAVRDAGLDLTKIDVDRVGIVEGTSVSGMESTVKAHNAMVSKGYRAMSPFTFINAYCGGGSGEIALELGVKGQVLTYCSGSSSGNDAVGHAMSLIKNDEADVMVCGGAEAPIMETFWNGFCAARVMTQMNDAPKTAMKPFDSNRDGFILGEGAGFLVLEEASHAIARGAKIYAEVAGHGRACEAFHSVSPNPDGAGPARAMEKALRAARVHPSEVQYINAHATATEGNDLAETVAIKKIFNGHSSRVAVSGTKPITGHLLGASGALESIVCALAIHKQEIPPTTNLHDPAAGCDLDYVVDGPRRYPVNVALNLNSGFGGKNACLVFKRFNEAG
jgi:3-oxoacyl-[acyl-carrier-protein] synthase II